MLFLKVHLSMFSGSCPEVKRKADHQFMADIGFNLLALYQFLVPPKRTNGQLGERTILSILLMPMLLYSVASLAVRTIFKLHCRWQSSPTSQSASVSVSCGTHFHRSTFSSHRKISRAKLSADERTRVFWLPDRPPGRA